MEGAVAGANSMLIQSGAARNNVLDRRLACSLAGVAGALNAVAFCAAGFFSANMTGNVSSLSNQVATGQWRSALFYGCIVVSFMSGAAASTLLIGMGRRRRYHGIYALAILMEAIMLVCLRCAGLWLSPRWRVPCLVVGLAFLMGLQNAVVTRISDARVRTTHVSGMATDVGIELGLLLDGLWKHELPGDDGTVRVRLRLHAQTILSFLVGGIAGVLSYRMIGDVTLWITAAVLGVIAVSTLLRTGRTVGADYALLPPSNDL